MRKQLDAGVIGLAQEYRQQVPEGFLAEVDAMESQLAQNRSVLSLVAKGRRKAKSSNVRILAAIMEEVSLFLCSDNSRYADLRGTGRKLTSDVAKFIAGVIVGLLGITAGVATACVAFVVLAVSRVGHAVFCRLNPPPKEHQKDRAE